MFWISKFGGLGRYLFDFIRISNICILGMSVMC